MRAGLGPARGSVSQGRPSAPTPKPPTRAEDLSARRKMRIERSALLNWPRVDCNASRATGESPIASDRSDLMVRKIGLSGRGWRSTLEGGRAAATTTGGGGGGVMKTD